MESAAISVVIPVYNVEDYIERCMGSVLNQTINNIEIILVDDGSPDKCPEICDSYQTKDTRIKVIHKKNGGLASARNAGMRVASGKYLFFLDSDDWLELDGLESLYIIAEEQQVDFVKYRAIRTGWPGMEENTPCMVEPVRELRHGYYNKAQIIEEVYPRLLATPQLTMGAVVGAWGALYNLDFLKKNKIEFYEEVKFSEDLIFSANVVRAANSFYFVDKPGVYHYFYNAKSISKSFREGRWESCKSTIAFCEKDFANDLDYDFSDELHHLRWFCIMVALNERRHLEGWKSRSAYCKRIINDSLVRNTKLETNILKVSYRQKILLLLIKLRLYMIVTLF